MGSTHTYQHDQRNAAIRININGELYDRDKAVISVFDSGFILGDGIWEGLRLHDGEVWTSSGDYCLDRITRRKVIELCKQNDIPVYEKNFSVMQAYGADEAFVTGTFAGLTPVFEIDGRGIGAARRGPMVDRLQRLYRGLIDSECQAGRR